MKALFYWSFTLGNGQAIMWALTHWGEVVVKFCGSGGVWLSESKNMSGDIISHTWKVSRKARRPTPGNEWRIWKVGKYGGIMKEEWDYEEGQRKKRRRGNQRKCKRREGNWKLLIRALRVTRNLNTCARFDPQPDPTILAPKQTEISDLAPLSITFLDTPHFKL